MRNILLGTVAALSLVTTAAMANDSEYEHLAQQFKQLNCVSGHLTPNQYNRCVELEQAQKQFYYKSYSNKIRSIPHIAGCSTIGKTECFSPIRDATAITPPNP